MPFPCHLELHLLGAARAVLGRLHSDRQGGCLVPALGAPAGQAPGREAAAEVSLGGSYLGHETDIRQSWAEVPMTTPFLQAEESGHRTIS